MSELKRRILDAIAWIVLIIGIIMVLWRVFGNSPTDIAVISPFIVFGLIKIWSNNEKIWELRIGMKHGFEKVRGDMSRMENKIDSLLNKNKRRK